MARTKNNQRSANRVAVDVGATGTRPIARGTVVILAGSVLAAVWALAMMTAPGRVGYYYFFIYAEYYMGVVVLVSLSITIMVGLVATDRLVLSIRQRVLLQSTHRTTGMMAIGALVLHVWTKEAEQHIRLIDVFIPFLYGGDNRLYVGFGTISGLIMVLVMWTGIARARFIGQGRPWMWRSIHAVSYLIWPIALVHGLSAGRAAKAWVTVSYIVCILLVLIGLAVRLSVSLNRRKDFASTASGLKPVGSMVPTAALAAKRPRRREKERDSGDTLGPVAVLDTWRPAAPPAAPVTAPPVLDEPRPRRDRGYTDAESRPPRERGFDDARERGFAAEPGPRPRRTPDDEFAGERPRGRRRAEYDDDADLPRPARRTRYADDELTDSRMRGIDDTTNRTRRPEPEDTGSYRRRPEPDDTQTFRPDFDEPAPRGRRYAEDDDPVPRSRRRAEEPRYDEPPRGRRRAPDDYDDIPRQRSSRYADTRYGRDEVDAPRTRRDRGADLNDRADTGRHSRTEFLDLADLADDPNYLPPDETPTLVDMASRRARRAATQQESVRGQAGRGARRGDRGWANDEVADDRYWSQLRGEAN